MGASAAFRLFRITPGSITAYPSSRLISLMRFILDTSRTMPPVGASTAPVTLLPEPLGMTGIFCSLAKAMIFDTCSVE